MKSGKKVLGILLAVLLLTGCGGPFSKTGSGEVASYDQAQYSEAGMSQEMSGYEGEDAPGEVADVARSEESEDMKAGDSGYQQKLVFRYYYEFDSTEYEKSVTFINQSLDKYQGYMEEFSEYGTESHYANMILRIPQEHIEEFLAETGSIGTVRSKEVTTEDISLQYYDTKAHLETMETQRDRLLELLKKAKSVSDITKIQSELTNVEYEINSYTSQLKVFDNQVDYVRVQISLNEVRVINPTESDGFFVRVKKGLSSNTADLLNNMVELAIWFLTMIPYFLVLGLVVIILTVSFKKLKIRRKGKIVKEENKD